MGSEEAELHEMVAAAAGAELRPGAVLVLFGDRAYLPIRIHHLVVAAVLESGAHAKAGFRFNRAGQAFRMPLQLTDGDIQHRHLHAAGDIHADCVWNNGVLGRQHAANRQAVAHVCVRHEGTGHCHGQQAGFLHLHHRLVFQSFAPLAVFDRLSARRRRSVHNGFGQFLAHRVFCKKSRIGHNGFQFLLQLGFVSTAEDELRNEIGRPPGGLTQRDSETNKIFSVHDQFDPALCCPTHTDKLFQLSDVGDHCCVEKREAPVSERPLDATTL